MLCIIILQKANIFQHFDQVYQERVLRAKDVQILQSSDSISDEKMVRKAEE